MYNNVYLLLGSNLGEKLLILKEALEFIRIEIGDVVKCSSFYESEAWGFSSEDIFVNQVVLIKTELSPFIILKKNQEIEKKLGRKKYGDRYQSRLIDIDILFFNDDIIETEELIIPHKQLHKRMFTLLPLYELDKNLLHPKFGKTISELIEKCKDEIKVKVIKKF